MRRSSASIALAICLSASPAFGKTKVACVGASSVEGVGAPAGQSYPDQIAPMLGAAYEVKNFGIGSRTALKDAANGNSYWITQQFTDSTAYDADIVVITFGGNDSKVENWDGLQGKAKFLGDYEALITNYASAPRHARPFCMLGTMIGDNVFGVRKAVLVDEVQPLIRQAAAATGCTIIDLHPLMDNRTDLFSADLLHPNAKGYGVMATAVYQAITAAPADAGTDATTNLPDASEAGQLEATADASPDRTIPSEPTPSDASPSPQNADARAPVEHDSATASATPANEASNGCACRAGTGNAPMGTGAMGTGAWLAGLLALGASTRIARRITNRRT